MSALLMQVEKAVGRNIELMFPRINSWYAQHVADLEFTQQVATILRMRWSSKKR